VLLRRRQRRVARRLRRLWELLQRRPDERQQLRRC
jgi:hypothetical protein